MLHSLDVNPVYVKGLNGRWPTTDKASVGIVTIKFGYHYNDVTMSTMASQITSLTIVYSTVYSRRRSKKASKLRVTGLCEGNSPVTGKFPTRRASYAENISIWWRHHVFADETASLGLIYLSDMMHSQLNAELLINNECIQWSCVYHIYSNALFFLSSEIKLISINYNFFDAVCQFIFNRACSKDSNK